MSLLRGGRLSEGSQEAMRFTASVRFDGPLVEPVIRINQAHMIMLARADLVAPRVVSSCLSALSSIDKTLTLEESLEDVHLNVEAKVIEMAGEEEGGQLNLGKSRNDQVATALRMAARSAILDLLVNLIALRRALVTRAEQHADTMMPGYTHTQHAQTTTLANLLLAHHDAINRDCERIMEAYARVNLSPMGAAALAGSALRMDRWLVARLLGFEGLVENTVDGVSSRDFILELMADISIMMVNLSRIAEELILWTTQEFDMADTPDELASTSSIMPHKKNPVVAEVIRAKAGKALGELASSLAIVKGLPMSYNLDLQELSKVFFSCLDSALSSSRLASGLIEGTKFRVSRMRELATNPLLMSTELADYLSTSQGIPFRTAHRMVGGLIRESLLAGKSFDQVVREKGPSIAKHKRDVEHDLDAVFDTQAATLGRPTLGGPSIEESKRMILDRMRIIEAQQKWVEERTAKLQQAGQELEALVKEYTEDVAR